MTQQSAPDLPGPATTLAVLQAVRLAGSADPDAVATRSGLTPTEASESIADLHNRGLLDEFDFAGHRSWILTDHGSTQLADLLEEERNTPGTADLLERTLAAFEPLNTDFVKQVSAYQLHGSPHLRDSLPTFAEDLTTVVDPLVAVLTRFSRYPLQFRRAAVRAVAGEDQWIAGIGLLSCHVVWAELHQDLFSSLGRSRSPERPGSVDDGSTS
jgi:hypothetical protein